MGGGAVFDEDPNDVRVGCDLPNIAGYVVSERARTADLQVQPCRTRSTRSRVGRYQAAKRDFPDSIDAATASWPRTCRRCSSCATSSWRRRSDRLHGRLQRRVRAVGETGWANFVAEMQSKDVKVLEYVGQPADFVALNQAMDTAGWRPR